MGLDVTPEALDRFLAGGEGPVVLVNLVRLQPGGDDAYPSRQALAELLHDPAFEAATPLRHEAVADGLLYAFT